MDVSSGFKEPGSLLGESRLYNLVHFNKYEGTCYRKVNKLDVYSSPEILCCITIYNETDVALLGSLAGIQQNIDYLISSGQRHLAENITICLICDGRERLSASAAQLLQELKLYDPNCIDPDAELHVFDSKLDSTLLRKHIYTDFLHHSAEESWQKVYLTATDGSEIYGLEGNDRISPRVLLCVKEANAGKLDSHWLFFSMLGTALTPQYCIQMDVGSIPKAPNFYTLWHFLEEHSQVGAATGSLIVPKPNSPWDLVSLWQFGNFWLDNLLFRPAESISGYLSVLPGQFTMMRWQTLIGNPSEAPQQESPLGHYFRGLGVLNAFEANMFLAEDRVLGFGIATGHTPGWQLSYLPSVVTVTDPCTALPELLRQRRRWINGSFACRLWVFAKTPGFLLDKKAAWAKKLSLATSTPLYLIRTLTEWFYPALSMLIYLLIYRGGVTLLEGTNMPTWPLQWAFGLGLCLLSIQTLLCLCDRLHEPFWIANVAYGGLFLSVILGVTVLTGYYLPLMAIVTTLVLIWSLIAAHSPQIANYAWYVYLPLYLLIDSAMTLLMRIYSFFKVNDCSWGTKGLQTGNLRKQYQRYFVSAWGLSNILLAFIVLRLHAFSMIVGVVGLDLGIGLLVGILFALRTMHQRNLRVIRGVES